MHSVAGQVYYIEGRGGNIGCSSATTVCSLSMTSLRLLRLQIAEIETAGLESNDFAAAADEVPHQNGKVANVCPYNVGDVLFSYCILNCLDVFGFISAFYEPDTARGFPLASLERPAANFQHDGR